MKPNAWSVTSCSESTPVKASRECPRHTPSRGRQLFACSCEDCLETGVSGHFQGAIRAIASSSWLIACAVARRRCARGRQRASQVTLGPFAGIEPGRAVPRAPPPDTARSPTAPSCDDFSRNASKKIYYMQKTPRQEYRFSASHLSDASVQANESRAGGIPLARRTGIDEAMTSKQNERECRKAERLVLLPSSVPPAFPRTAAVLTLLTMANRGGGSVPGQRICGVRHGAFRDMHTRAGIARVAGDGILQRGLRVRNDGFLPMPAIPQQAHRGGRMPGMSGLDGPGSRRKRLWLRQSPRRPCLLPKCAESGIGGPEDGLERRSVAFFDMPFMPDKRSLQGGTARRRCAGKRLEVAGEVRPNRPRVIDPPLRFRMAGR